MPSICVENVRRSWKPRRARSVAAAISLLRVRGFGWFAVRNAVADRWEAFYQMCLCKKMDVVAVLEKAKTLR